ncbi:MAG: DUF4358 domain-containing protein [Ruminococcaceae bacterium]|nr:DUF4358 domain-containing protein [Oscillospiraceae bacterium]
MKQLWSKLKTLSSFQIFNIATISLFVVLVLCNLLMPKKEYSALENRYLQKFPIPSLVTLKDGTYMQQFENFVNDQLFGRSFLVRQRANAERIMGKKENNGVFFAKDGYLIEKPAQFDSEIILKNIQAIKLLDSLNRFHITVSVVPPSYEILRDKLPSYVYQPVILNLNHLIQKEFENTNIQNADPSGYLWEHRDEYIYYKTDHHQTSRGSQLSYEFLAGYLGYEPFGDDQFRKTDMSDSFLGTTYSKGLVQVTPDAITAYETDREVTVSFPEEEIQTNSMYFHNRLEEKDQYSFFLDGNHGLTVVQGAEKNGRHLAIFKDSYAHSLTPFLSNHFESIHLIDLRYFQGDILQYLHENQLKDILFYYSASSMMTKGTLEKVTVSVETSPYAHFQPYGRVDESEPVDISYFSDATFVGDSLTVGFQMSTDLVNSNFLCSTALSVTGLGSVEASDGGGTILDRINNDSYKKIYILLGINELIDPSNKDAFIEKYSGLIDTVKQSHPDAFVYIQSIFPVSAEEHAKGRIRNDYIAEFNAALEQLAMNKGTYYLDVASALADENGCLPEESTFDGIHLHQEYYLKWLEYLKTHSVYDPEAAVPAAAEVQPEEPIVSDYDVISIATNLKDAIAFSDNMGEIGSAMLYKTHGLDPEIMANAAGFIGGGATAEEIAIFEVKEKRDAVPVKQLLEEYVQTRKASFETYLPTEVPKLEHPFLFQKGKLIVLVIADDYSQAEEIIRNTIK